MGIYVYVHVGIWERPPAERKSKKIVETDHHLRGDGAGKNNAAAERNSYTSRAQKMYNWLVIICSVGRGRGGQSRRPIERLVFSIYICCTSVGCEISRHTRASDEEWDARLFQLATLARRARYSTTTRYTQREKDREKRWLLARCSFFSPFYLFFPSLFFFPFTWTNWRYVCLHFYRSRFTMDISFKIIKPAPPGGYSRVFFVFVFVCVRTFTSCRTKIRWLCTP